MKQGNTGLAQDLRSCVVGLILWLEVRDTMEEANRPGGFSDRLKGLIGAVSDGSCWNMEIREDDPAHPANRVEWSPSFRRALGFSGEDEFPDTFAQWADRLHPADRKRVLSEFAAHLKDPAGAASCGMDYRIRMKNGKYRRFHMGMAATRDESGAPLRVAGTFREITELTRTQDVLENILNSLDSCIYVTDLETDEILFVNQKMTAEFGGGKDLKGDLCWRSLRPGAQARRELLAHPGESAVCEREERVADKTFRVTDRMILLPGGRRAHLGQAVEITAIRRAEECARLMLDATPLGCVVWDAGLRLIAGNEAAAKLFGFEGRIDHADQFFRFCPERQPCGRGSRELAAERVREAFEEGRCVFEWTHQAQGGTLIPAQVTLVRIQYGKDFLVAGYIRDLREHNRLLLEIDRKNRMLRTVNRISSILLKSSSGDFEEDLRHSMGILAEAADADRVHVWKNYRKDGELYYAPAYGWSGGTSLPGGEAAQGVRYGDMAPEWEETLSGGRCVNGVAREMPSSVRASMEEQGALSLLIAPIFQGEDFWGFISFDDCHSERVFSENEEVFLRSVSELIAGALSRNRLEAEAGKIYFDQLTGIYNRRFLEEHIEALIQTLSRSCGALSVMMIDIDQFKEYNDTYGHLEGDKCLRVIATVLRDRILRKEDFVARYGGEEFVAVLPNTGEEGARLLAGRLLAEVRACGMPHEKSDVADCVTISIGVATGTAEYTHRGCDYIRRADECMYAAKRQGRDRYVFSDL